jgi:hypothetical protein
MARVVNFVEGHTGDTGVSLFTCMLLEFFRLKQLDPLLVDLDRINPDVWKRYRHLCRSNTQININSPTLDRESELANLLSLTYESNKQAIVNIPARSLEQVDNFVEQNQFDRVRLRRFFVSTLTRKSWSCFESVADYLENSFELILVHNLIEGMEMTPGQLDFCEHRGIEIIKISKIEFPQIDLDLLEEKRDLSLNEFSSVLTEQGAKRLRVHMERVFRYLDRIVMGV